MCENATSEFINCQQLKQVSRHISFDVLLLHGNIYTDLTQTVILISSVKKTSILHEVLFVCVTARQDEGAKISF